ncbi:hypothetical protein [Roseovarius pacificus]|uniref:hypothetical protein n=1 Tax=Roseovarius pacificus TaxID=337701 RepID=UPI002A18B14B|nr:hypothetical protein [Roseovarius pacificus]
MIGIRRAARLDARDLTDLLNAIIRNGGATALTRELDRDAMLGWIDRTPERSA